MATKGNENEIPHLNRRITIYRDDSTVPIVYNDVKTFFWTTGNTVLTVARWYAAESDEYYYTHWPRDRFVWFKDEPAETVE